MFSITQFHSIIYDRADFIEHHIKWDETNLKKNLFAVIDIAFRQNESKYVQERKKKKPP